MCDRVAIISDGRILACDSPQTLKQNLLETPIAKIEVSSVQADFGFIGNMQGVVGFSEVRNIQTGVTTLKVMVRDEKVFSEIETRLNAEKLKVLSVNETEPTLEDVYIRLVGKGFAEVEEKTDA
jgi:ABC-2 type transport system ATP-binding protein